MKSNAFTRSKDSATSFLLNALFCCLGLVSSLFPLMSQKTRAPAPARVSKTPPFRRARLSKINAKIFFFLCKFDQAASWQNICKSSRQSAGSRL